MSNRITTATLAHYIGAECEWEYYYQRDTRDKGWKTEIDKVTLDVLSDLEYPDKYRNHTLILRPIESMTQEDILGLTTDKVNIEGALRAVKNRGITGIFAWLRDHSETFIIDYLRSRGIDLGGEIEQDIAIHSGPFGETVNFETKTVWVPSLIGAGVAKEAKP